MSYSLKKIITLCFLIFSLLGPTIANNKLKEIIVVYDSINSTIHYKSHTIKFRDTTINGELCTIRQENKGVPRGGSQKVHITNSTNTLVYEYFSSFSPGGSHSYKRIFNYNENNYLNSSFYTSRASIPSAKTKGVDDTLIVEEWNNSGLWTKGKSHFRYGNDNTVYEKNRRFNENNLIVYSLKTWHDTIKIEEINYYYDTTINYELEPGIRGTLYTTIINGFEDEDEPINDTTYLYKYIVDNNTTGEAHGTPTKWSTRKITFNNEHDGSIDSIQNEEYRGSAGWLLVTTHIYKYKQPTKISMSKQSKALKTYSINSNKNKTVVQFNNTNNMRISLFDISGKKIHDYKTNNTNLTIINHTNFSTGRYLLKGNGWVEKIIIQ